MAPGEQARSTTPSLAPVRRSVRHAPSRSKAHAAARLQDANRRLAEALPLKQLNEVTRRAEQAAAALGEEGRSTGISALTSAPLPSRAALEQVELANLQRGFAERRRLLHGSLTVTQVAALMGTGRQTPHDRVRSGTLLGIKEAGQWRFPAWQFDPGGPDGVVAGLPEAIRALRGPLSPLGRIKWFVTPKPLLNGMTPLEALHEGRVEEVVAEAATVGAT